MREGERGQTTAEYAMALSILVPVCFAVFVAVGGDLRDSLLDSSVRLFP